MRANFHRSIADIESKEWDGLWQTQYPFTKHAFFTALEDSGSIDSKTSQGSGWQSHHLTISMDRDIVAAMPLFLKSHSYGEYVFDWSWANAYHQAGINYYPKIVNTIPFTPTTGPRIGYANFLTASEKQACEKLIFESLKQSAEKNNYSGFHSLFPAGTHKPSLDDAGLARRTGYQFHWFNQNYANFDEFLTNFNSRKRKNIKKERAKVHQQNIDIVMRHASEIEPIEWDTFCTLYQRTYLKRSGHSGYLGPDFFHRLAYAFPQNVLIASAHHHKQMIAAALYLRDENTLYGRYWGTKIDVDGLHFECCYYRGIEYAIEHKLTRFDPGAQGEHKIQRGFTPIKTHSYHWLRHPAFRRAISEFVTQETRQIDRYIKDARALLPFKDGVPVVESDALTN